MSREDLVHVQIGAAYIPLLDERDRERIVAFLRALAHELEGKHDEWGQAIWVLGPVTAKWPGLRSSSARSTNDTTRTGRPRPDFPDGS